MAELFDNYKNYRMLRQYFSFHQLSDILDGKDVIRLDADIAHKLFFQRATTSQRQNVIEQITQLVNLLSQYDNQSDKQFLVLLNMARHYGLPKFKAPNSKLARLIVNAPDFYIQTDYIIIRTAMALAVIERFHIDLDSYNFDDIAVVKPVLSQPKKNKTHQHAVQIKQLIKNSNIYLNRLEFNFDKLPVKFRINTVKPELNDVLHKMLTREFSEQDIAGITSEDLDLIVNQFIEIMRVQIIQLYVFDKFNQGVSSQGLDLVQSSQENGSFDFDSLNKPLAFLKVLIDEVSNHKSVEFLYITPELADVLNPFLDSKLAQSIASNTSVNGFRKSAFPRFRSFRQIITRYNSDRSMRFVSIKMLHQLYDDFRLFGTHTAMYTNAYIEAQTPEWRTSMGNLSATTIQIETEVSNEKLLQ